MPIVSALLIAGLGLLFSASMGDLVFSQMMVDSLTGGPVRMDWLTLSHLERIAVAIANAIGWVLVIGTALGWRKERVRRSGDLT